MPVSGKFGVVNGISTVRNWAINDTMAAQQYVASNTLFGNGRVNGLEEWNGSYDCYGALPPVMPGEALSFIGYTGPTNGSTGNGLRYGGSALVESVQITWNWSAAEIINAVTNFKGHLALTPADGAEIYDVTIPTVPSPIGTRIDYSVDGNTWTELTDLSQAQLTFNCALQEYANSSTAIGGRLWKGQLSGPLDWTLAITQQSVDRAAIAKGDSLQFRLYTSTTEYYELKWGKVTEFSGITVDRQTGAIIQQTINVGMNGFDVDAGSYAASTGHVLLPGGAQWWPGEQPGTGT